MASGDERDDPMMRAINASLPSAPSAAIDFERLAEALRPLASPLRLKILAYLTKPHYLEEIGSYLKLSRQAVRKHLEQLVAIGVLERHVGVRDSRPVTDYVINPQAIFLIYEEFEKLGSLNRAEKPEHLMRTRPGDGRQLPERPRAGPALTVVRGFNHGRRFALVPARGRPAVLGRDTSCPVAVEHDPYASNRHAEIRWENSRFILADLRSTNGTEHNWTRLPPGGEVTLRHGDLIGVGKTQFLFWDAA